MCSTIVSLGKVTTLRTWVGLLPKVFWIIKRFRIKKFEHTIVSTLVDILLTIYTSNKVQH